MIFVPHLAMLFLLAQSSASEWLDLGRSQFAQQNFGAARSSFEQAVAVNGQSLDALRLLGLTEFELKDYNAAYSSWLKAASLDKKEERSRYYIGRLFFEADLPNEAAAWLRQALALQPSDFSAMTYLGLCAEALGYDDTAFALYQNAVAASTSAGKPFSWAYLSLGKILGKRGNTKQALQILTRGSETCPEPHELTALGEMLASQKQNERAEQVFRQSIALDPGLSQTHYRLGLLLKTTGRAQESQKEMDLFQQAKDQEAKAPKITVLRKQ